MNITKNTLITKKKNILITATVLSVIIATTGLTTAGIPLLPKAFAQEMQQQPPAMQNTNATSTTNAGTTSTASTGGNSVLSGIISSVQQNNAGAPQWLAAGSWTLVTDKPLFVQGSSPTVKNFSAVVDMVSFANGTMFHSHHFYNFANGHVLYNNNNVTDINGTMTITTEQGTTENVVAYLHFQNNFMSIWVNPGQINNHFGPTPINGMVLNAEQLAGIRSLEAPQIQSQQQQSMQNSTTGGGAGGSTTTQDNMPM
jgi:hypothetical protein